MICDSSSRTSEFSHGNNTALCLLVTAQWRIWANLFDHSLGWCESCDLDNQCPAHLRESRPYGHVVFWRWWVQVPYGHEQLSEKAYKIDILNLSRIKKRPGKKNGLIPNYDNEVHNEWILDFFIHFWFNYRYYLAESKRLNIFEIKIFTSRHWLSTVPNQVRIEVYYRFICSLWPPTMLNLYPVALILYTY